MLGLRFSSCLSESHPKEPPINVHFLETLINYKGVLGGSDDVAHPVCYNHFTLTRRTDTLFRRYCRSKFTLRHLPAWEGGGGQTVGQAGGLSSRKVRRCVRAADATLGGPRWPDEVYVQWVPKLPATGHGCVTPHSAKKFSRASSAGIECSTLD